MLIDMHTHTFPSSMAVKAVEKLSKEAQIHPFSDGTEDGLLSSMRDSCVDISVVLPVATNPLSVRRINETLHKNTSKLIYLGAMHPDCPFWEEELVRLKNAGFRGIKLHPVYQGVDFDDCRTLRLLDKAASLGLFVVVHAGWDIAFPGIKRCTPDMVKNVILHVGNVPLILAHMGGWRCWDEVCEKLIDTSVYIDTSFSVGTITARNDAFVYHAPMLSDEAFLQILRSFGAHRVVFGSDSPWGSQKESLAAINRLELCEAERNAIFSGNAKKLLNL